MDFPLEPRDEFAMSVDPQTLDIDLFATKAVGSLNDATLWNDSFKTSNDSLKIGAVQYESSFKTGSDCESSFCSVLASNSIEFFKGSVFDDVKKRVDVVLRHNGHMIPVDVKARKALRRNGRIQNRYMFVELHARGSLFQGESTVLAQEIGDSAFLLISKSALQNYCKKKFDTSLPRVYFPEQSLYRAYRRDGKAVEWIGLVDLIDVVETTGAVVLRKLK